MIEAILELVLYLALSKRARRLESLALYPAIPLPGYLEGV